ncbi:hypothetical protein BDF20DRAFT_879919 [Mycotypha africana]|uniref:uncharacterized protein n=1 Tax=Mycotypha africana TaxID=64632 RepID=UPI0023000B5D|nr:uncharacterized protein BDF20DRAFT_879919 [Mycotypha africana]KAI8975658.1 hypothetical protein BDF20DRAFT_879919 [Mycotypha africana]
MLRTQRRTHRFMSWLLAFGTTGIVFIRFFIILFPCFLLFLLDFKILFAFCAFRTNYRYHEVAY